jgi:hypothetical protein
MPGLRGRVSGASYIEPSAAMPKQAGASVHFPQRISLGGDGRRYSSERAESRADTGRRSITLAVSNA